MARVFNITSAVFDGQTMGAPVSARIALQGEVVDEAAGKDVYPVLNRLVLRKAVIQVSFNDHDDLQAMQKNLGKHGVSGTLTIKAPDTADPPADQTATITNALCTEIIQDAQHAQFGSHIATFEAITTDGQTNPIAWA